MSALSTSIAFHSTTDASLRIWGKAISDRLIAGGWVQTADTGQVNWTTIVIGAVNALSGYEIFRSNDAGGGLTELYMKFEYGVGVAAGVPGIRITFGTGSSGAGAITGTLAGSYYFSNAGTPATGAAQQNLSAVGGAGAGSAFVSMFMHQASSTGNMFAFFLERTRDGSGNLLNEWSALILTGSTWWHRVFNATRAYHDAVTNGIIIQASSSVNIYDGIVGLGIVLPQKAGYVPPIIGLFGCFNGQLGADNSIVSITSYGVAHNYIINTTLSGASRYLFPPAGASANCISRFE